MGKGSKYLNRADGAVGERKRILKSKERPLKGQKANIQANKKKKGEKKKKNQTKRNLCLIPILFVCFFQRQGYNSEDRPEGQNLLTVSTPVFLVIQSNAKEDVSLAMTR